MNLTEEQKKDIQERIDVAGKKIAEVLKEHEVQIGGKVVKVEIAPGVFGDAVQVGYLDLKFAPKPSAETKDGKVELKED